MGGVKLLEFSMGSACEKGRQATQPVQAKGACARDEPTPCPILQSFEKMLQYYVSIENKPSAIVQRALAFQQNPTMFVKSEVDLLAEHVNTLVTETVALYLADNEKP